MIRLSVAAPSSGFLSKSTYVITLLLVRLQAATAPLDCIESMARMVRRMHAVQPVSISLAYLTGRVVASRCAKFIEVSGSERVRRRGLSQALRNQHHHHPPVHLRVALYVDSVWLLRTKTRAKKFGFHFYWSPCDYPCPSSAGPRDGPRNSSVRRRDPCLDLSSTLGNPFKHVRFCWHMSRAGPALLAETRRKGNSSLQIIVLQWHMTEHEIMFADRVV